MSIPFVRHADGSTVHFADFDGMDTYQEQPGDSWRDLCADCKEEIYMAQDGYCEVCSEDRRAMYDDEDRFLDHGPLDSDPYDREPWPI